MQHSDGATKPVVTAGLLLETSLGSLTIDIFGADCPALSGNFLNLCRTELWNGAVATEVIPEVAIFFSLSADSTYDSLLRTTLAERASAAQTEQPPSTNPLVHSFWSLLPRSAPASADPTAATAAALHPLPGTSAPALHGNSPDPVAQQSAALHHALQQEVRLCKRRRCVGLAASPAGTKTTSGSGGVFQPVFRPVTHPHSSVNTSNAANAGIAAASPCTVGRAGSLLVDVTAPTLRFGLTLSNRTMDFLDKQYVVIGAVAEGESVLKRMQRAPLRDRDPANNHLNSSRVLAAQATASTTSVVTSHSQQDIVAGRLASAWPYPVRLLRIKRALVLPTAGTEKFVPTPASDLVELSRFEVGLGSSSAAQQQQQQQERRRRVGEALREAGCFAWWAPEAAVRAAHTQLVELVQLSLTARQYTAPARPTSVAEAAALLQHSHASDTNNIERPFVILTEQGKPPHGTGTSRTKTTTTVLKATLQGEVNKEEVHITYNPHYTGDYLSSEDDEDVYADEFSAQNNFSGRGGGSNGMTSTQALRLSARQLEERRKLFMQQHQEKANETFSLMLNVLNGVADARGELKPPENVLFVCKLNPVTTGDGLAVCFAQFGRVVSAEVIYDAKTKQSLCYGFVEFETVEACFRAFQKMDQALIDDCRIHVDFSQSVSKLWAQRQRELRKRNRPN